MRVASFLTSHLRQNRHNAGVFGAWAIAEALPALLSGFVVSRIADAALRADPAAAFGWVAVLGTSLLTGAAASRGTVIRLGALAEPLRDLLVRRVVNDALRRTLSRAGAAPLAISAQEPGVTQLTTFVETVRQLFAAALLATRDNAIMLVAALVGLTVLSPALAAVTCCAVVVAVGLMCWQTRRIYATQQRAATASEQLGSALEAAIQGSGDILACGASDRVARQIDSLAACQARQTRALSRTGVARGAAVATGGYLPIVALLAVGPALVRGGGISAADTIGAITYLYAYIAPAIRALSQSIMSVGLPLHAALSRLLASDAVPDAFNDTSRSVGPARPGHPPSGGLFPPVGAATPTVSIRELSYSYGTQSEPIVVGFSADIAPGEYLAVVGPSGAGKSTFADLLTGLTLPQAGQVMIGDCQGSHVGAGSLRDVIALVPQEAYVFTGTVRDNLRYLNPAVPDEGLRAAVAAVGGAELLRRLGGLGADLHPGDLSAGEKQLIALARVWASPAPVVVLDEATSSLDAPLAAQVERAFRRRPGTLIVITHQLASVRHADRVLVMDGPRTRLGTHAELKTAMPVYAQLLQARWGGTDSSFGKPAG